MATEPTEHTALIINDDRQASPERQSSPSNIKQSLFYANTAATAGAVLAIVPAVYGAVSGNALTSSVMTAGFAAVALTLAAVNFMRAGSKNCAATTIFVGAQIAATIATEVSSIVNITNNPNLASALSVVGGAAMNAAVTATATLSCSNKK